MPVDSCLVSHSGLNAVHDHAVKVAARALRFNLIVLGDPREAGLPDKHLRGFGTTDSASPQVSPDKYHLSLLSILKTLRTENSRRRKYYLIVIVFQSALQPGPFLQLWRMVSDFLHLD
jgi:hypothetical protein